MKKTRFILNNDTSINSYGFRILTAGINLTRFKQNPVMLDQHLNTTSAVIGRWLDLSATEIKIRIDGISDAELKKYAQQSLDRYKQSGFKGSFETFGVPEVSKCDMADITSSDENQGVYLVKKNEISFGQNGYRQKIELGQPLSIKEAE